MDDDYTPTTGDVRDAYLRARYYLDNAPEGAEGYRAVPLGFDRWLAKHDAEVAKEYRDAYEELRRQGLEMHRVLLDLWRAFTPDSEHLTFGEDPERVRDAVYAEMRRLRSIIRKGNDNG